MDSVGLEGGGGADFFATGRGTAVSVAAVSVAAVSVAAVSVADVAVADGPPDDRVFGGAELLRANPVAVS